MMNIFNCPHCSENSVSIQNYSRAVPMGRRKVTISGLQKSVCLACGYEFATSDQVDHNHSLLIQRSEKVRGAVFPGLLRSIRDRWDITQRELSRMFGAGSSAVGKWESGAPMSGPSALLAQCAANVPGTVEFLAELANVQLKADTSHETYESNIQINVGAIARKPHRPIFVYGHAANAPVYIHNPKEIYKEALAA